MIIISFPRSGQHLVEKILKFCCKEHDLEFSHCEFYTCCGSIPCKNHNIFSKNHDFILDKNSNLMSEYRQEIIVDENTKILTLYRKDIIIQLESYYRYDIKVHNKKYKYKDLLFFIANKTDYYNNFINKWINNKSKNILKVEYYEILENPEKISKKIFKHFFPYVKVKNSVFKKLINLELEVTNTPGVNIFYHKISLINQIDDKIYKRLKKDLNLQ
jgi:hypothetical protein